MISENNRIRSYLLNYGKEKPVIQVKLISIKLKLGLVQYKRTAFN
ncbi:MAG: hypothetical protein ACI8QQ_003199 [Psychroserpens sp.]|jgi:hypothetical protein